MFKCTIDPSSSFILLSGHNCFFFKLFCIINTIIKNHIYFIYLIEFNNNFKIKNPFTSIFCGNKFWMQNNNLIEFEWFKLEIVFPLLMVKNRRIKYPDILWPHEWFERWDTSRLINLNIRIRNKWFEAWLLITPEVGRESISPTMWDWAGH